MLELTYLQEAELRYFRGWQWLGIRGSEDWVAGTVSRDEDLPDVSA